MARKWNEWKKMRLPESAIASILATGADVPSAIYGNGLYEVWVSSVPVELAGWPDVIWLSIKRLDRRSMHDWRELQRIKNELCGTNCEAVEIYPNEDRHTDTSNQYHLWVFPPHFVIPFGYMTRCVASDESFKGIQTKKSVQRPFGPTHTAPEALDDEDLDLLRAMQSAAKGSFVPDFYAMPKKRMGRQAYQRLVQRAIVKTGNGDSEVTRYG